MMFNRQLLLRYVEYVAVSASVAGAIMAVVTQKIVYGFAPLSVSGVLNFISRRQWEQQVAQRLVQTTTQIDQRLDGLSQQNRLLEQRINVLQQPPKTKSTSAEVLRPSPEEIIQPESLVNRADLDAVIVELRQMQVALEQMQLAEQTRVEDAITKLRTDLDEVSIELSQLKTEITSLLGFPFPTSSNSPSEDELSLQLPDPTQVFTLEINLGIDFGTGFTKVCFRDLASDRSEIVAFSEASEVELEHALLSTKVAILEDGTLLTGLTVSEWATKTYPVWKTLEFIKMRLAHLDLPEESKWRLEEIPELNDAETVENICAYYLSRVIARAQQWIQHNRADLFKNQMTRWSLNIGVPVEYCDSPALKRFQRVLSLAWLLANTPDSKGVLTIPSLNKLGTSLRRRMQQNLDEDLDCFTTPEISAAAWSFLSSRQAQERFYTFFDFGDGTLDGTAFRFWRENDGELKVDFYAGQVRPLGVTAFSQQTASELHTSPTTVHQTLLEWHESTDQVLYSRLLSSQTRKDIQKLVAFVVKRGKDKHRENRGVMAKDELGDRLEIFVGGGGGHNPFLQATIQATYEDFQHKNAGIPPYQLKRIPVPDDLSMNGLDPIEFHRFAVAYGLCIPDWEGPKILLPSQIEMNKKSEPPYNRIPRYEDTKDST
jgi:hypothetical protein